MIIAVGGSDCFTQDLDDMVPDNQKAQQVTDDIKHAKSTPKSEYVVPFGKFKDRKLGEIPGEELMDYVQYLERKAKEEKKVIKGMVAEFIQAATFHLKESAS